MSFITYTDYPSCEEALEKLNQEVTDLKAVHEVYTNKVAEVKDLQAKCLTGIKHQQYRAKQIMKSLKTMSKIATGEEKEKIDALIKKISSRNALFQDLEETLPHKNGIYLNIVLGEVNVSLLSKADKFAYKQDYEKFKLILTLIILVFSAVLWAFLKHRVFDAAFQFLLVWYYCTLTIREHILMVNGSRIKGWWVTHHFVSVLCAGVVLTWPRNEFYYAFRDIFNLFSFYLSIVQVVQYYYQRGCLYKLRALGERHSMDITVDGFMSWMWRRLGYVLPFLFAGYLFQLYNSYFLFRLYQRPGCEDWQVIFLSFLFLVFFIGNTSTVLAVLRHKLKSEGYSVRTKLRHKYRFNLMTRNSPSTSSDGTKEATKES